MIIELDFNLEEIVLLDELVQTYSQRLLTTYPMAKKAHEFVEKVRNAYCDAKWGQPNE